MPDSQGEWEEYQTISDKDIPIYKSKEQEKLKSLNDWAKHQAKYLKSQCGENTWNIGTKVRVKGSSIYVFKTSEQILHGKLIRGEIKTENGLKMSEHQFYGLPPKYFDYYTKEEPPYKKGIEDEIAKDYHAGLVLKISGDYDPELFDDHNTWGVITKLIDRYHYEVRQEASSNPPELGKTLLIRDTDVKWWIGDKKYDYVGIGAERHKKEVLPLVNLIIS
jgi:hypothetical protein